MNVSLLKLYAITRTETASIIDDVIAAIKGGVTCLQFRNKTLKQTDFVHLAFKLRQITKHYQIPLIINDQVEVAKIIAADGVHIGPDDISWQQARRILGDASIIGLSIKNIEQAKRHKTADVNYFGVGPIFYTRTKEDAGKPMGCKCLASIVDVLHPKPVVAIGGIQQNNLSQVLACHVKGVALISAIMCAKNIENTARSYRHVIDASF